MPPVLRVSRGAAWAVAAVAVAAAGWAFFGLSPAISVYNAPPSRPGIVMLGDSLTYGIGASEGNNLPAQLGQLIGRPVINSGIPGETTEGALGRMDRVLASRPGTVIVFLGGNDWLQRLELRRTESNLATIIQRCQAAGAMVVLVGFKGGRGDGYAAMFLRLAQTYGCLYVPNALGGVMLDPRRKADALHPNDEGYAIIAGRIAQRLKPLLATGPAAR